MTDTPLGRRKADPLDLLREIIAANPTADEDTIRRKLFDAVTAKGNEAHLRAIFDRVYLDMYGKGKVPDELVGIPYIDAIAAAKPTRQ